MNVIQRIIGTIFPPYRFSVLRKEQQLFFDAIIHSLPDDIAPFKEHTLKGVMLWLQDWNDFPGFKFVPMSYGTERFEKKGVNFRLSGIQIYSVLNNKWEEVEIIIHNNLVRGLKITNSNYQLKEFDLNKINSQHTIKHPVHFEPGEAELLYQSLAPDLQAKIDPVLFGEIEFNNKTFFSFYDLEDGNYLAIDKDEKVYSLIHDAQPTAARMKISLREILEQLENNTFDIAEHMTERYSK
jgi:hypothetical protein